MDFWIMTWLVIYFVVVAYIGLVSRKKASKGLEEHYVGGRKIPSWALGCSFAVAACSAACYMGEPGLTSVIGWPYFWVVISLPIGMVIGSTFILKRFRGQTKKLDALTMPSYLRKRYDSRTMQLLVASIIVLLYTFPLMAQYKGGAVLLDSFCGIPYELSLVGFTAIVAIYVSIGGRHAITWTDVFQAIPMATLAVVLLAVGLHSVGGFAGLDAKLAAIDPNMLRVAEPSDSAIIASPAGIIGMFVFWIVIFVCQPYLACTSMAMRSTSKRSLLNFFLTIVILLTAINAFYIVGLIGRATLGEIPNADYVTPMMIQKLLPSFIGGFMMIGILAAMMSTTDSILLMVGQAISGDICRDNLYPKMTKEGALKLTQVSIIAVSFIVLALSLLKPPEFLSLILYAGLSGVGCAVAAPLIAGLYWKKASKWGAVASSIGGIVFYCILVLGMGMNFFAACAVSVGLAAVVMIVVSLVTTPPPESILKTLFD